MPDAAELTEQLRVMPAVQSYTLEFIIGADDDAPLVDSLAFAATL